jgi:hypothetical protein
MRDAADLDAERKAIVDRDLGPGPMIFVPGHHHRQPASDNHNDGERTKKRESCYLDLSNHRIDQGRPYSAYSRARD